MTTNPAELVKRLRAVADTSSGRLSEILNEAAAALAAQQDVREVHASDCAIHNAPALPVGPCDCGLEPVAWRWRSPVMMHWVYDPDSAWREAHKDDPEIEFQPLYTAPQR